MAINVNFRKINVSKQTDYVYHGAMGDIVIRPDEKAGITIDIIHELHRADNRAVDQNLKQAHRPMTEAERRDIEAWRSDPDHPERTKADFPDRYQRWNLSIDGCWEDDGSNALDSDPVMARACQEVQDNVPPMVKRLRDFIATLTERQQEFYRLVYIEEYTKAEAAKIMGITPQRATTIDHQIRDNIKKRLNI